MEGPMRVQLRQQWIVGVSMLIVPALTAAQGTTITGRVVSDAGTPLAGVSVFVSSMNLGTQTTRDGDYTFTIPAARATNQDVTLTARIIGYSPRSVQITLTPGRTITQNFVLPVNP